jgi:hypothetical protein
MTFLAINVGVKRVGPIDFKGKIKFIHGKKPEIM